MVYFVILLQIINFNPNFDLTIARHDTGNIILQVTDRAHIGGETTGTTNIPYGLRYPKAGGLDHLFFGGFGITNSRVYVADGHYAPNYRIDRDFRIRDPIRRVSRYGLQEWEASYIDSGHPTPKNIKVTQYSLGSPDPNYDDGVIMIFKIKNEGTATVESLYAGIILDLDMRGTISEYAYTDTLRRCVYQRQSTTENPTVGIKILSPTNWANLACIYNPTYVHPYYGLPDTFKYKFLTGMIRQYSGTTASDWSIVASVGPFRLEPQQEYVCAFGILGGASISGFLTNADSLQAFYDRLVGINENKKEKKVILLTNPIILNSKSKLQIKVNIDEELKINLYDLCGKFVDCLGKINGKRIHTLSLDKKYSKGIYFLRIEGKENYLTKKLIYVK
ncbi:MAG: T9SS type A sorting domain-containing protein [candidate division WOR-3 bacterium]|nr:T9SS type A sorting domain-containing protein [candidate division WOR-3 bacterium]MCX7836878.1 T9SS type A sorting domain-containing protein [candidate division WOR-3 bacterium]MDW8114423.1 T9SS type A sorting domain-containing protein [candidate division WOR-3 bacterium]